MTQTILITGATSGFGYSIAELFANNGWNVIAIGRRRERLDQLIKTFTSSKVYPICEDICEPERLQAAIARRPDNFLQITTLINNAGLALGTAPAQQCNLADWHQMIQTNIIGLVNLTHYLLPELISRRGIIINMSSIAARYPYPGGNVYCATKAFISQLTLCLRSDLHGSGVRVTAIEPGMAQTEFTLVRTKGDQAASDALYENVNPITAHDIAQTVFWIATLPEHLNINRLEIMPVTQSCGGFQIARNEVLRFSGK